MKKIITSENAPAPIGPYNQAILSGDTLYISGQIAIDPETNDLMVQNIRSETNLVMRNLGNVLKAAGMDYINLVKCSIFIKNMDQFGEINDIYGSYFTDMPPARETVEVARLPKNVNVEISGIAVR